MNAEFNWWLLIVGLVVGAALVWLVVADSNRREADLLDEELPVEATWISEAMADDGELVDADTVERILRLHRTYLAAPPPDEPDPELERSNRRRVRVPRQPPPEGDPESGRRADAERHDEPSATLTARDAGPSRAP